MKEPEADVEMKEPEGTGMPRGSLMGPLASMVVPVSGMSQVWR